jgi:predicted PurR-regulated permease PerM
MGNIGAHVQTAIDNYQKLPPTVKTTLQAALASVTSHAAEVATNVAGMLVVGASALFSLGLEMFLALILTFWFLKDGPRIAKACVAVVPERYRDDVCVIASSFDESFSGYLLATAINC